jgi:protein tyrosine phosphatase
MNDKRERAVDDIDDDLIIIRKFSLKHGNEERTITHLQYTGWTDFGVPDQPVGILQLVHQADEAAASFSNSGPMIVHCSAGCGRSGTFCAIDTIIQRLSHERDVYTCTSSDKIVETVGRFREERMSMVQTHRQFVFCYEAILWWLLGYGYLPASSSPCNNTFSIPKITPMNNIFSLENSSFS